MIASLHGRLEALGAGGAIINVNGIGFQVYMPSSTLSTLGNIGQDVYLSTYFHLREDNAALYGFASGEERQLFETLLGVSGIGPRLALAALSTMSAEQLTMAIATGSIDLLTTIPGIGKKTAERLVLELKDKIGAGLVATPAARIVQENVDVLAALTALGYSVSEASRAVATLPSASDLRLEEKIKLVLQHLGK